ncbi:hypothetical protein DFH06DRAFT_134417 [Mycena polygramma]|nr:hypothetical protein DFH06DRAFT_134417 [Mycena polygramma]
MYSFPRAALSWSSLSSDEYSVSSSSDSSVTGPLLDSHERIPNELWLEIANNFWEYDRQTLLNFSLACRTFRGVSRPRVFAKFAFEVYRITTEGALLLPSPAEVDMRLERLDFWCSPEIAPLVRSCEIDESWSNRNSSDWTYNAVDPYVLLDAVFERLPHFMCLQQLTARHLHFTQNGINILSRLPPLTRLAVSLCRVALHEHIKPHLHTLRVSDFDLSPGYNRPPGNDFWIPMLQPQDLRSLRVSFDACCMGRQISDIPLFPNVQRLEASMDFPTPADNLAILAKFPAVRILRLRGKELLETAVSPCSPAIFPALREYSGPYQSLPLFSVAESLTHFTTSHCSPQELISRIQGIQSNITSVHVDFEKLNIAEFNTLIALLPRLTELLIRIRVSSISDMFKRETYNVKKLAKDMVVHGRYGDGLRTGFKPSAFFLTLPNVPFLPPTLERLAIAWECYELLDMEDFCAYKVPDFVKLRDTLRARCPRVKWLYLHGFYFMLEWRDCDGKVSQRTAKNFLKGCRESPEIFHDFYLM